MRPGNPNRTGARPAPRAPRAYPKVDGSQVVLDVGPTTDPSPQGRAIFDAVQADAFFEVSITGENVRLSVYMGTSRATRLNDLQPPLKFSAIGNCTIEATQDDPTQPARAWSAVRPATGASPVEAAGLKSFAGVPADDRLQMEAFEVVAITAATIDIDGNPVPLAIGESIRVRWPTDLTGGTILVRYQL